MEFDILRDLAIAAVPVAYLAFVALRAERRSA